MDEEDYQALRRFRFKQLNPTKAPPRNKARVPGSGVLAVVAGGVANEAPPEREQFAPEQFSVMTMEREAAFVVNAGVPLKSENVPVLSIL